MRLPENNPGRSQSDGDTSNGTMSSNEEPDFSEFMWMAEEDLEAFDHKVITEVAQVMMQQTTVVNNGCLREEEEEFLQRMLEEEEQRDTVYYTDYLEEKRRGNETGQLESSMQKMGVSQDMAAKSTLNPYAAEFVPAQSTSDTSKPPDLVSQNRSQEKPT